MFVIPLEPLTNWFSLLKAECLRGRVTEGAIGVPTVFKATMFEYFKSLVVSAFKIQVYLGLKYFWYFPFFHKIF